MSQAHTSGSAPRQRGTKGATIAGAIVSMLAAIALLALVGSESAAGAERACTPGVREVNGTLSRVFCGPARANVVLAGKKLAFVNGECVRTGSYFTINVGTTSLGLSKRPPNYFGITVGRTPLTPSSKKAAKDGAYTGALITFVWRGKGYTVDNGAKLVLKNGRRAGSFTGTVSSRQQVSGTFGC
jgi:hypothetical protein